MGRGLAERPGFEVDVGETAGVEAGGGDIDELVAGVLEVEAEAVGEGGGEVLVDAAREGGREGGGVGVGEGASGEEGEDGGELLGGGDGIEFGEGGGEEVVAELRGAEGEAAGEDGDIGPEEAVAVGEDGAEAFGDGKEGVGHKVSLAFLVAG